MIYLFTCDCVASACYISLGLKAPRFLKRENPQIGAKEFPAKYDVVFCLF